MKTMTALTLRKKLGSILDEVAAKKEQVLISRANKPLAVIISVEEYDEKISKNNREQKLKEVFSKMKEWRERNKEKTGINTVKIIREIRNNR